MKLQTINGKQIAVITDKLHDQEEAVANADLMLEAFDVAQTTGRTPGQLAGERAELIAMLREIVPDEHTFNTGPMTLRKARELLSRLDPPVEASTDENRKH